jgi:antitoxin component of MazEF toxin-antitoxin module
VGGNGVMAAIREGDEGSTGGAWESEIGGEQELLLRRHRKARKQEREKKRREKTKKNEEKKTREKQEKKNERKN